MANIKFSAFNTETNSANVDFLVGYQGTTMKKIAPSNLGSVTSLNDLSDVSIDLTNDSAYFINIPSGLSGATGNLVIGESAGNALTSGDKNIAIGFRAMNEKTVGSDNIAIGYDANRYPAANSNAVAIGTEAVFNATGNDAIGIGFQAGYAGNQDGSVSIGTSAHGTGFNANDAVAIGNVAAYSGVAVGSVAIGKRAGFIGNDKSNSVLIGFDAGRSVNVNGNISIGYQAGYSNSTGSANTNIGLQAGYSNTTAQDRTMIGDEAGAFQTGAQNTGVGRYACRQGTGLQNTAVGASAMVGNMSGGSFNTVVGYNAMSTNGNKSNNVVVGRDAGRLITTGGTNTILGSLAGDNLTTGSNNILIGYDATASAVGVSNEITLGDANITALRIPGLQSGASDGDVLTFASGTGLITLQAAGGGGATSLNGLTDCLVDTDSLYVGTVPAGLSGNPQDNTTLGINAGTALTTGERNTFLGNDCGKACATGDNNVAIGHDASLSETGSSSIAIGLNANRGGGSGSGVIIGEGAAYNGAASNAVVIGQAAGNSSAGNETVLIGQFAGAFGTAASKQIAIGAGQAGRSNTADDHMDVGYAAGYSNTSGQYNTNIGFKAGNTNTTSSSRTMLGYEAGLNNTGSNNVFLGKATGKGAGSGAQVIAIGQGVMETASQIDNSVLIGNYMAANCTSGAGSTVAIGVNCLSVSGYSGEGNTAIGHQAGNNLTSGDNNTLLGRNAGDAITTGTNNIMIGQAAEVSAAGGTNQIVIGQGSTGLGDNTTLLGNGSTTTTVIKGNVGLLDATSPGSALDILSATNGTDSVQLRLRTTAVAANTLQKVVGFYQASTSERGYIGVNQYSVNYNTSSDYRLKENIVEINDGISRLKSLKPCRFNFISPLDENGNKLDPNPKTMDGFMAHEAQAVVPECADGDKDAVDENGKPVYQGIDQSKIVPLLTAALKEAVTKIEQLETRIQTLENN